MAAHAGLPKRGAFTLAVVSTAKYFVPMLLVRFGELHPDVEVVLQASTTARTCWACWPAARRTWSVMGRRSGQSGDCEATAFCHQPAGHRVSAAAARADHAPQTVPFAALGEHALCGARGRLGHPRGDGAPVCRSTTARFEGGHGNAQQRNHQAGRDGRHGAGLFERCARCARSWRAVYLAVLDIEGHCRSIGHWYVTHHGRQDAVARRARLQGAF
jgi:hypothetical protein